MDMYYRVEDTGYPGHRIAFNEIKEGYAIYINGNLSFKINDYVFVKADSNGQICPEINEEGRGRIIDIDHDKEGRFICVLMDNGQCGQLKTNQIELIKRNH